MRKNLMICSAGADSYHPSWLAAEADARSWDMLVLCYNDITPPGDIVIHHQSFKFTALYQEISKRPILVANYENIAFWDDDLALAEGTTVNKVFELFTRTGTALAQPALTPGSPSTWAITTRRPDLAYRVTNFVEIMCPIFTSQCFRDLFGTFGLSAGYGLDSIVWPAMLSAAGRQCSILDSTPVRHTRPLHASGFNAQFRVRDDLARIKQSFSAREIKPIVLREVPHFVF